MECNLATHSLYESLQWSETASAHACNTNQQKGNSVRRQTPSPEGWTGAQLGKDLPKTGMAEQYKCSRTSAPKCGCPLFSSRLAEWIVRFLCQFPRWCHSGTFWSECREIINEETWYSSQNDFTRASPATIDAPAIWQRIIPSSGSSHRSSISKWRDALTAVLFLFDDTPDILDINIPDITSLNEISTRHQQTSIY